MVSAIYAQFRYCDRIDPEIINLVKNKFKTSQEINKVSTDLAILLEQAKRQKEENHEWLKKMVRPPGAHTGVDEVRPAESSKHVKRCMGDIDYN